MQLGGPAPGLRHRVGGRWTGAMQVLLAAAYAFAWARPDLLVGPTLATLVLFILFEALVLLFLARVTHALQRQIEDPDERRSRRTRLRIAIGVLLVPIGAALLAQGLGPWLVAAGLLVPLAVHGIALRRGLRDVDLLEAKRNLWWDELAVYGPAALVAALLAGIGLLPAGGITAEVLASSGLAGGLPWLQASVPAALFTGMVYHMVLGALSLVTLGRTGTRTVTGSTAEGPVFRVRR